MGTEALKHKTQVWRYLIPFLKGLCGCPKRTQTPRHSPLSCNMGSPPFALGNNAVPLITASKLPPGGQQARRGQSGLLQKSTVGTVENSFCILGIFALRTFWCLALKQNLKGGDPGQRGRPRTLCIQLLCVLLLCKQAACTFTNIFLGPLRP